MITPPPPPPPQVYLPTALLYVRHHAAGHDKPHLAWPKAAAEAARARATHAGLLAGWLAGLPPAAARCLDVQVGGPALLHRRSSALQSAHSSMHQAVPAAAQYFVICYELLHLPSYEAGVTFGWLSRPACKLVYLIQIQQVHLSSPRLYIAKAVQV